MEHQGKTLLDYLEILRKDFRLFLVPFVIIFLLGLMFALTLPSIYRSQGVILVESQQIPSDLIRSTITTFADERIRIIKQIVMTRENLLSIINKYNLYTNDKQLKLSNQELISRIRRNIIVHLPPNEIQGSPYSRGRPNSLAFVVAFEHEDPATSQKVANELVTLFLKENLKSRTQRATETTEFLANEADKLRQQINIIEQQVAEFKQKHERSLPENLNLNNQMLERAQNTLREIHRDIKAEEEQLSYLEVQLATLQSSLPSDDDVPLTPKQQLAVLYSEHSALSNRYGPRHPDILKLERQIKELENRLQNADSESGNPQAENPALLLIEAKIRSTKEKIRSLELQEQDLARTVRDLQHRIMQTPQVERGLKALERDYENLKEKYDDLMDKTTEATLSQSMEEQSKAERFTLIEPPVFPEEPIRPNRLKIFVMALILAVASGIALVIAKDELKGGIRNVRQLARLTGAAPMISIGYIENSADHVLRRRRRIIVAASLTTFVFILVTVIHFAYKPLDEIATIIAARF